MTEGNEKPRGSVEVRSGESYDGEVPQGRTEFESFRMSFTQLHSTKGNVSEAMHTTPLTLLERLRRPHEQAAWARFVDLYTPLLFSWARRSGLQDSDASDLVQDVFGVVVKEMPHFEHSGRSGAFRHWLRATLVFRMRAFWRTRKKAPVSTADDATEQQLRELEDPSSALSQLWDREHNEFITRRLLALLEPEFTPSTWEAFRRQVLDEQRAADVAASLGLTVNAVHVAKSRVLRRLREELAGMLD